MYNEPSEMYFTWKTVDVSGFSFDAGDCACSTEGKAAEQTQASSTTNVSNSAVTRILASATVLMAVVASRGAVDESADAGVLVDRCGLLVRRGGMAVDASKAGIVGGNLVAIVANGGVVWNREVRVIESGTEPVCGGVTAVAGRGISSRHMVWNRATEGLRAIPLCDMAAVAGRIRRRQRIVVIHMAVCAGLHAARSGNNVAARESPSSGAVIEFAIGPSNRVVAGGTLSDRKGGGHMIRDTATESLCAVPLRKVAGRVPTVARLNRKIVIVVYVALRAGSCRVSPGQCEACDGMVERTDIRPGSCVVTRRAVGHRKDRPRC